MICEFVFCFVGVRVNEAVIVVSGFVLISFGAIAVSLMFVSGLVCVVLLVLFVRLLLDLELLD